MDRERTVGVREASIWIAGLRTATAIVDDLGTHIIIAIFYTDNLSFISLALSGSRASAERHAARD